MRRATVTITDELEGALEAYRRGLDFPPSLAALMQAALKEYLARRGYAESVESSVEDNKPSMYEDAPSVKGGKTASEVVLEDRR